MWVILLDHSGSMGDPFSGQEGFAGRSKFSIASIKLDAAKQALLEHLLGLGAPSKVALIEFTSKASVIFEGSSSDFPSIQTILDSLHPDDGTDIAFALDRTAEFINTIRNEQVIRILIISDGLSDREAAEASAQHLAAKGAIIDVILIDPTPQGELVARAIAMNGSITGVRSAQELSDSVATARALERLQEEEVAKVVNAYEKKKSDTTGQIPPDERLSFTTGYQGTVSPGIWYPLLIYIHTAGMKKIVEQLLQKFSKSLGIDPSISTTMSSILLKRETTLKFVPHLEGFTFNPAVSEVKWYEDIQEVNFRLRADADIAGRIVPGSIDIYSGSLLIAQLPISITVRGTNVSEEQPQLTSTTTEIFSSIFASYSHKDAALVEACAAAYKALGISMYIDAISLHSGDIWKRVLQEFIVQSDLFQLYWSDNSSKSNPVQEEWQYALN